MRCLILGGTGMLGHQLLQSWSERHEVRATLRGPLADYRRYGLFTADNTIDGVDVSDKQRVLSVLREYRPDAVINAVGIIKQSPAKRDAALCMEINAGFPHQLRTYCEVLGIRMVQISTDCVFNGLSGGYTERDTPNAMDLYGKSKAIGEVTAAPCITLRTSIIGLELETRRSLVEWFLSQRGTIRGFTRAIYTGLTTIEIARVIERLLVDHPRMSGLWQVASEPISKFELLNTLARCLGRDDIRIEPELKFSCDRSLNGDAFKNETQYEPPSWQQMLTELASQIKTEGRRHVAA